MKINDAKLEGLLNGSQLHEDRSNALYQQIEGFYYWSFSKPAAC